MAINTHLRLASEDFLRRQRHNTYLQSAFEDFPGGQYRVNDLQFVRDNICVILTFYLRLQILWNISYVILKKVLGS